MVQFYIDFMAIPYFQIFLWSMWPMLSSAEFPKDYENDLAPNGYTVFILTRNPFAHISWIFSSSGPFPK